MQRMFSMFPAGAAGLGLLLLRIDVGMQFSRNPVDSVITNTFVYSLQLASIGFGALIAVGLFTPLVSLLATAEAIFLAMAFPGSQSIELMFQMLPPAALIFLGPGTYSIDAKLFARRLMPDHRG